MKVKSESEVAQLCLNLSNPMDCSLPGSCVHGIFQARVLEWGAIAFSAQYARILQHSQISVIHHINKLKIKNYTIILIDEEKFFLQNSTPIYDKEKKQTLQKVST